jgi:glycosyltransferase involved in cell wall biosynthesis
VILFISGEYPPDVGGVGDYTARLQVALKDRDWHSDVLTRRHVRRWDARSFIRLLRFAPHSGIVHIQFQAGAYGLLGDVCLMPALLRRARRRVCSVTTFHDVRVPYLFPRAGGLRRRAVELLARTSDAVVAADERDLRALRRVSRRQYHIPIGSNVACSPPPGFDRDAFRRKLGLTRGDLAIVYFGLLTSAVLFHTFEQILRRCPGARILLLGAHTRVAHPQIIQPGWLHPRDLSAYLLAGDVALLPYADGASARHGSLFACAEHGLPIVSTLPVGSEVAPFVEAVANTPEALAEAVLRIAASSAQRIADSRALAETVRWSRIASDHVHMYNQLLGSQR